MIETRFKPIYLVHEAGVSPSHVQVVIEGINEVLSLAGVASRIQIINLGIWRDQIWRSADGELLPYRSVDWYIRQGREKSTQSNQLFSWAMITEIIQDPWQRNQRHYDVMILESDMYYTGCNFIIGQAMEGILALISVNRFLVLDDDLQRKCIKTETMHEIGHMFGIPNEKRTDGSLTESLGNHCTNKCVMRQGLTIPDDFISLSKDRLLYGPFCEACLGELRQFFR